MIRSRLPASALQHEVETKSECNMFRLGFCVYGDRCRFHHTRFPGPPPDPRTFEAAKPKQHRRRDDKAS